MKIIEIIKVLSSKPRTAGTSGNRKARKFIIKELERLGYSVRIYEAPFSSWKLTKKPELRMKLKRWVSIDALPVAWSGSGNISGTLAENGKIKTFEAYEFLKYAITNSGKKSGYIITRPDIAWLQPLNKPSRKPYFMVRPTACKIIKNLLGKNRIIEVKAEVRSTLRKSRIYNIVAEGREEKKIIVCAHYDSMFNLGANDNASGVASVLKLAEKFQGRGIEFILFDAEEWNKYGSYQYVKNLGNKTKNIKALINIDMVGHGKPYVIASKKIVATVERSLKKTGIAAGIKTDIRAPFDYWPFYKKGVGIIHFGCSPYKYCHDKEDTLDKIRIAPINKVIKMAEEIISVMI